MRRHNLAFIDVETTGLDPERHEVIELGGLVVRQVATPGRGAKLEVIEEFEFKIQPERIGDAEPEALRINGYNEADWLFAVSPVQAFTAFNKKVAGAIPVGQNIGFDLSFINRALKRFGLKNELHYHNIDLISLAFAKFHHKAEPKNFGLWALAEHFGIKNERAHTALSDARTTFEIYKKVLEL